MKNIFIITCFIGLLMAAGLVFSSCNRSSCYTDIRCLSEWGITSTYNGIPTSWSVGTRYGTCYDTRCEAYEMLGKTSSNVVSGTFQCNCK